MENKNIEVANNNTNVYVTEFVVLLNFFLPGSREADLYSTMRQMMTLDYDNVTFSTIDSYHNRRRAEKAFDKEHGIERTESTPPYDKKLLRPYKHSELKSSFKLQASKYADLNTKYHFIGFTKQINLGDWLCSKKLIEEALFGYTVHYVPLIQKQPSGYTNYFDLRFTNKNGNSNNSVFSFTQKSMICSLMTCLERKELQEDEVIIKPIIEILGNYFRTFNDFRSYNLKKEDFSNDLPERNLNIRKDAREKLRKKIRRTKWICNFTRPELCLNDPLQFDMFDESKLIGLNSRVK